MRKVDITAEIFIARPRIQVAAFAADPDNATKWYVNIKSVEWKTPRPLTIGSKVAFKARFLGKDLEYIYEIIDYRPGQILVMRTAQGPFPMETTYEWESIGAGTRMILRNTGFPKGFSKLVAPFMAAGIRKANRKDLLQLKRLLENEL